MTKEYYERYWNHKLPKMTFFDNEPEWNEKTLAHYEIMIRPWLVGLSLLDFGCGEGYLVNRLDKILKAYGLDISVKAIELARKNFPNQKFFVLGTPLNLKVDNIICTDVMEHIFDFDEFFAQIKEHLPVSGRMMVATNDMCFIKFLAIGLFFKDTFHHPYSPHIRFFTKKSLRELFEYHDFRVLHYERVGNYFGLISKGQFVVAERIK